MAPFEPPPFPSTLVNFGHREREKNLDWCDFSIKTNPPSPGIHMRMRAKSSSPSSSSSSHPFSRSSSSSGLGVRVSVKPEYRVTTPSQLSPRVGNIPLSIFQFDFGLERNILTEAEKERKNLSKLGLGNLPSETIEMMSSLGSVLDPVASKCIASGLSGDAVPLAVANYGDDPIKVKEFVNGYALLEEMGFSSNNVAEALVMYDNDTDKALAHILNNSF
ncbi:Ubiquitin-associated protein like [Actinidia chinensis var. chinensis]|uniref:Ubiquitin-associated protein like n=1 Tax=Actinidia chinensis var. chinensis TaxID=1590841 RepID=A0A2R6REX5_ACTCC|nr:Ubiquitin-associated protein like [Actinidia chinensis var. chinensis]